MSQGDLMSQDSVMLQPDIHSQLDHLLSQDSTYQGDRLAFKYFCTCTYYLLYCIIFRFASQNQFLSQFSQN